MDILEDIILKLDELLEADRFDELQFDGLLKTSKERFNLKIRMIDFEFYNEERIIDAQAEKKKGLELQDFEYTANYRELERECLKYIEFKAELNIRKSMFLCEPIFLFYCFFGTAKNDLLVKERIMADEGYVKLRIKI